MAAGLTSSRRVRSLLGWSSYQVTGLYKKPAAIDVQREMAQLCPSASKHQQGSRFGRNRGLKLPDLDQARQEFEQYLGGKVEWSRYDESGN